MIPAYDGVLYYNMGYAYFSSLKILNYVNFTKLYCGVNLFCNDFF